MNDGKTEFLVISSGHLKFSIPITAIQVGDSTVSVSESARNIGVEFDSRLSHESQITKVCRRSYFQIRQLSRLRQFLPRQALERLVHAFITANLDYCNSLYVGLPKWQLDKLQRVQNAAARVITGTRRREHITPILKSLHWLPVYYRIHFKILVLVYKCIHGMAPTYLSELLKGHQPTRVLRSTSRDALVTPFTKTKLVSERAFSVVGPRLWNALPQNIQCAQSLTCFKGVLKTHLFKNAFT